MEGLVHVGLWTLHLHVDRSHGFDVAWQQFFVFGYPFYMTLVVELLETARLGVHEGGCFDSLKHYTVLCFPIFLDDHRLVVVNLANGHVCCFGLDV